MTKTSNKAAKANACWGDIVEDPKAEFPPLFDQLLDSGGEHRDGEDDDDVNLELLGDENDEDAIFPPAQTSRPGSTSVGCPPPAPMKSTCMRCVNGQQLGWLLTGPLQRMTRVRRYVSSRTLSRAVVVSWA